LSYLQQTAASIQNLSSASTITQEALSHNNANTLDQLATMIDQRFDRVDNNIIVLNQQVNCCHDKNLASFRNIKRRLVTVEENPVVPQPLFPLGKLQKLTLQVTQMQPPPPPPLFLQGRNNDDMVAGKAPILGKFSSDRNLLEG